MGLNLGPAEKQASVLFNNCDKCVEIIIVVGLYLWLDCYCYTTAATVGLILMVLQLPQSNYDYNCNYILVDFHAEQIKAVREMV